MIPTGLAWMLQFVMPRRTWYREVYLQSVHWKEKRARKLKQVHGYCERCGRMYSIVKIGSKDVKLAFMDVHHRNYKRLFREQMSDLQVLCRSCHKKEHGR